MKQDTAGVASTQQKRGRAESVTRDLDDALATMEWQRRVVSRLKVVIARCQLEDRAPRDEEVSEAMEDGTRAAA